MLLTNSSDFDSFDHGPAQCRFRFIQPPRNGESLPHDSDLEVNGEAHPDWSLHRVFGPNKTNRVTKVLPDPCEEQLDMPPASMQRCDFDFRPRRAVGPPPPPPVSAFSFLWGKLKCWRVHSHVSVMG